MQKKIALILILVISLSLIYFFLNKDNSVLPTSKKKTRNLEYSDWLIYRGNQCLTGESKENSSPIIKLKWRFPTKAEISSTIIISKGIIYLSSNDSRLYALNANTGKAVWSFKADDILSASPLFYNDSIYIGSESGTFYAVDAKSGKLQWQLKTEGQFKASANWVILNSGKVAILVGNYNNYLYCLDSNNGKVIWKYQTQNYINGTPAVSDNKVIFGGCDGFLRIINIEDGKEFKKVNIGSYIPGSPVVTKKFCYVGQYQGKVICFNFIKNIIAWQFKTTNKNTHFTLTPSLINNRLVIVGSNIVYCLNAKTGKKIWQFKARAKVSSSILISKNKQLLFTANDGRLYAISLVNGKLLWDYELGSNSSSMPVISDGKIFLGNDDGILYTLEMER